MGETRPLVVKIGGGLLRDEGLDGLRRGCAHAIEIAARRPVLVIPGGGPFADAVRAVDAQTAMPEAVAHALALRAMDQLGVLLASMLPGAEVVSRLLVPHTLGLLVAATAFAGRREIPESWAVTSDSLAVLAAAAIGADEALLLKPVAGVVARWPSDEPPLAQLTASDLAAMQARGGGRVVDRYLPEAVRRTGVAALLRRPGADVPDGTRIVPG